MSECMQTFAGDLFTTACGLPDRMWFGTNKVYLRPLFEAYSRMYPRAEASRSWDGFAGMLVRANRERLLTLSRADLVEAMNPDLVWPSEVRSTGATWHFLLVETD